MSKGRFFGMAVLAVLTLVFSCSMAKGGVDIKSYKNVEKYGIAVAKLVGSERSLSSKDADVESEYHAKRLLIKAKGELPDIERFSPKVILAGPKGEYTVQFNSQDDAKNCREFLTSEENIVYCNPDSIVSVSASDFVQEAVMKSKAAPSKYAHYSWGVRIMQTNRYSEYLVAKTDRGVVVAALDTGVGKHRLFNKKMFSDGYDFFYGTEGARNDPNGHGTHVSGTIIDCTQPLNVKILPVRVMNEYGRGYSSIAAAGVRYAYTQGAKVINLSLGGGHDQLLDDTISEALDAGCVVVNSAGNDSVDVKDVCPAHMPEIITVSAINEEMKRESFSNYGAQIDVAAPGFSILSAAPNNGYLLDSGTSMSAPYISAACAMILIDNPSLSPQGVWQKLKSACEDLGEAGWDKYYGWGVPKLWKLIDASDEGDVLVSKEGTFKIDCGRLVTLESSEAASFAVTWLKDASVVWNNSETGVITLEWGKSENGVCPLIIKPVARGCAVVTLLNENNPDDCLKFSVTSDLLSERDGYLYAPSGLFRIKIDKEIALTSYEEARYPIEMLRDGKVGAYSNTLSALADIRDFDGSNPVLRIAPFENGESIIRISTWNEPDDYVDVIATVNLPDDGSYRYSSGGAIRIKADETVTLTSKYTKALSVLCAYGMPMCENSNPEVVDVKIGRFANRIDDISLTLLSNGTATIAVFKEDEPEDILYIDVVVDMNNGTVEKTLFSLSPQRAQASPGKTVTFDIEAANNQGFNACKLLVGYDAEIFNLKSVTKGAASVDFNLIDGANGPGSHALEFVGIDNAYKNGTLATVVLEVKETEREGDSAITLTCSEIANELNEEAPFEVRGATVSVKQQARIAPQSVTLDRTSLAMIVGASDTLTATVLPQDAFDKSVKWETNDASIATVDQNGVVKAVGAGTTTIAVIASAPGVQATCLVAVSEQTPPANVFFEMKKITLGKKTTRQLKLVFVPSEATAAVTWKSNKPKIASVDANGLVTAKKIGTAKITAQTSNGQKASIKIKVVKNSPKTAAGD